MDGGSEWAVVIQTHNGNAVMLRANRQETANKIAEWLLKHNCAVVVFHDPPLIGQC